MSSEADLTTTSPWSAYAGLPILSGDNFADTPQQLGVAEQMNRSITEGSTNSNSIGPQLNLLDSNHPSGGKSNETRESLVEQAPHDGKIKTPCNNYLRDSLTAQGAVCVEWKSNRASEPLMSQPHGTWPDYHPKTMNGIYLTWPANGLICFDRARMSFVLSSSLS
jgi:hypothetical protein